VVGYENSQAHLLDELRRIELRLHREVLCFRKRAPQEVPAVPGLYISEEEIDVLLADEAPVATESEPVSAEFLPLAERQTAWEMSIAQKKALTRANGTVLRLDRLRDEFHLTPFDVDVLLLSLAPEVERKYETLYAYLQDDITKKQPSVDLALSLLCRSLPEKLVARQRLTASAPLRTYNLLHLSPDLPQGPTSLLSRTLTVDERIVDYLLGMDDLDPRLTPFAQRLMPRAQLADLVLAAEVKQRLLRLLDKRETTGGRLMLYFQGPDGVGKRTTAEALCRESARELVVIDGERLLHSQPAAFVSTTRLALREARLRNAALYWEGFEALLADEKRPLREEFLRELITESDLTFLAGVSPWEPTDVMHQTRFVRLEFPLPTYADRVQLWMLALNDTAAKPSEVDVQVLASRFRLSGGQIRDAAATARSLGRWRDPEAEPVGMADLTAACRFHSNPQLARLAQKITPHYTWEDLILPTDRLQQLRELYDWVKHRAQVYDEWGFNGKLSLGKGLNALFAGPSGTGKTMAAEVIARDLGLDLYKIDLSTVVSKYIGETEKNLSRIFAEAATSNAILFFDEADALFGKRSEVRDAHDRYANIEIGYLLQKMEEYEGIVILATNLRKNLDDAFVRRMHFTIEFPFPSEPERRRMWTRIWPQGVPRSTEVDVEFLARRFEVTGGNIRNIALAAAFLAAANGGQVTMQHLLQATRREYQKLGKVVMAGEFGE
jgi:SpoVK/Ycf46/Vps4 family AAA+-type ATPase